MDVFKSSARLCFKCKQNYVEHGKHMNFLLVSSFLNITIKILRWFKLG